MSAAQKIKVLVVDDHPVVRKGLVSCLASKPNIEVVGEAADGAEALRKAHELSPDVVLMDIEMPRINGLKATEMLRKEVPSARVVILSRDNNWDYVARMIQAGARGYVLKDAAAEDILRAVELVTCDETFFSPELTQTAMNKIVNRIGGSGLFGDLTNREREVLALIAEGHSNKEIASRFCISVRTVETHRERVMRKLGINNVAGLTKYAISTGLISLNGANP